MLITRKKNILILSEGTTQTLDGATLTAEKSIQLILQWLERNFVYAGIIIGQTVIYLLMVQKFINLKQKNLKLIQFHYVQEIT